MISFVGTKQIQDLLTDINYWQVPLTTADGAPWPSTDSQDDKRTSNVLVHQGFMARSQHIPIKQLYEHARASGKRLLLCGAHTAATTPRQQRTSVLHGPTWPAIRYVGKGLPVDLHNNSTVVPVSMQGILLVELLQHCARFAFLVWILKPHHIYTASPLHAWPSAILK